MAIYTYTQEQIDFLKNNHVTPHIKGITNQGQGEPFDMPVVAGTEVNRGDTVYYVADEGYEFDIVSDRGINWYGIYWQDKREGREHVKQFFERYKPDRPTIVERPNRSYSFNEANVIVLKSNIDNIITKGVNDVFLINDTTMRGIINGNFKLNDKDYNKYILGLIELPFKIDDKLIDSEDEPINLAGLETEYKGSLLKTDVVKFNLGSIDIPNTNDNLLNIKNKKAILHLPFVNAIELDINYVVGYTISIEYLINLYDGIAVVNVYSSKTDKIINSTSVDLNISIPFGSVDTIPKNNDPRNISLGINNGVKTPFIEIIHNRAILENGFFTIPIPDEGLLRGNRGYVQIDKIELRTKALNTERELLESQLKNGVIINV